MAGRGELVRDECHNETAMQVKLTHEKLDQHSHVLQQIAGDIAAIRAKDRFLSSGVDVFLDSSSGGHGLGENVGLAGRVPAANAANGTMEAISSMSTSPCSKSPEPEQPFLSLGRQSCPSAAESVFGPAFSASSSTVSTPNPMLSSVAPKAAFATWSRDGEIQAIHQDNFVAASSPSSLAPSAASSPLPLNPSTIKEVGGPSNWNQHGDAQGARRGRRRWRWGVGCR